MRKSLFVSLFAASLLIGCGDTKTNFSPPPEVNGASEFVAGSIAIDLKDNLSASDIQEMSKEYGFIIRDSSPLAHQVGNLEIADVDPDQEAGILDKLAHDPRVEEAEPTMTVQAFLEPADPLYKDQWGMKYIHATDAWSYADGTGVLVSVIDTGIDQTHPDLQGVSFLPGYNFANGNDDTRDRQSHGTHVASSLVERINDIGGVGASPGARVLPVKGLGDNGNGTMEGIASSIVFATDKGANIINMSLGSSAKSAIVGKAVKYAHDKGVMVIVAAGNSGSPITGSPAADIGAFPVAASDINGNLASFSSYGKELKITCPGKDILQSTIDRDGKHIYASFSGTSMASPFCASGFTLLASQGITDPDKALEIIQSTAEHKSDTNKFGGGIMDSHAAVKSVYLNHLLLRGGFLLAFTFLLLTLLKKNKLTLVQGTAKTVAAIAAVFASVGLLFFLPMTNLLPYLGSFRWVGELLSRPFCEWDMIYSVSLHKWLPLASAFPPFVLVALGNHKAILRSLAGGLGLGVACYLAQVAYSAEIQFVMGTLLMRAWCLVNIFACLWVAKNTLSVRK